MAATTNLLVRDLVEGRTYRLLNRTTVIPDNGTSELQQSTAIVNLFNLYERAHRLFSKLTYDDDKYLLYFETLPQDNTRDRYIVLNTGQLPQGGSTMFNEEPIIGGKRKGKSRKQKRRAKKTRKH